MKTIKVEVIQEFEVELDEAKFTEEFMDEFRAHFYGFNTIEDHAKHLAQMEARGLIFSSEAFVEGYGPLNEMGISINVIDQTEAVLT